MQARAQRHHKVVQPDLVRARMAHVLAVIGVVLRPSIQQACVHCGHVLVTHNNTRGGSNCEESACNPS